MAKTKLKSKSATEIIDKAHIDMLRIVDQLYDSLTNLHFEGKVSTGKNVKTICECIKYFKENIPSHITLEEEIVFPFLDTHIPKLTPTLQFLRADHNEFKETFDSFGKLFHKMENTKGDQAYSHILERVKDKGIYLVCIMRNHIQIENNVVCASVNVQLHKNEKKELCKKLSEKEHP